MKEKMLKGQPERKLGSPKREAHQTHSRSLSRNPMSQRRVGANIQHFQRKEFPTQNFISSQNKLHKWGRNKIFFTQANAEGICHHQTCLARAPEGSTKYGKEKPLLASKQTKTTEIPQTSDTVKQPHKQVCKISNYCYENKIKSTITILTLNVND